MMKFPSFSQWKQIFKVLTKREKITLLVFLVLASSSFIFLATSYYINNTNVMPAFGGTHTEGIVGQPRFINPIYGETNDIDRTLIDLVYSGLMTYDKDGNIVNDLASSYKVSDDGKTYTFTLKNNIFWHDGKTLTTDDVIFTIKTIQNSDYKSSLRANWVDVDIEKISDKSFDIILKQPYNSFLENCTLKIIPKHIWENISPENFILSLYNLQPIGSGPFAFANITQSKTGFIETLHLRSNRKFYNKTSFISGVSFKFFEKIGDLIKTTNLQTIDGFAVAPLDKNGYDIEKIYQSWSKEKFVAHSFSLPRYFAVFFNNQKSSIFSDINIRKALTHSVNKSELTQKVDQGTNTNVSIVDSPILPDFYGFQKLTHTYEFDVKKAKTLLDKSGFKENVSGTREKAINKKPAFQFKSYLKLGSKGIEVTQLQACLTHLPSGVIYLLNGNFANILKGETNGTYGTRTENAVIEFQKEYLPKLKPTGEVGPSTRQKLNELCISSTPSSQPLKFILVTINQPQLLEIANLLKEYWQAVGVTVDINAVSTTDLKPIIKNRSYDALLYGETLGTEPDLYPFWFSSQKLDPGLNLSSYENKDIDKLLKDARQTLDSDQKQQYLEKIQNIIISDAPALFLYNPDYIYWASTKVQGIETTKIADPAKRFSNITNWYLKTKRVWK